MDPVVEDQPVTLVMVLQRHLAGQDAIELMAPALGQGSGQPVEENGADHLVRSALEAGGQSLVGGQDAAIRIEQQGAVDGGVEQGLGQFLAFPQCLLDLLAPDDARQGVGDHLEKALLLLLPLMSMADIGIENAQQIGPVEDGDAIMPVLVQVRDSGQVAPIDVAGENHFPPLGGHAAEAVPDIDPRALPDDLG
jgi:hypothetical protein